MPAPGGLHHGCLRCLPQAWLAKAEKLLSRETDGVQAGLTLLSPSMQLVLRKKFL